MRRLLTATFFLLAVSSLGQQPPPGGDPLAEHVFAPELVMQNQKAIGLREAQKNAIREDILKAQSRFTELQWQLQDAMETVLSLLQQNSPDEQKVLAELDKVLAAEREVKRTQISLLIRIKNKLTPEQQARLQELRKTKRD
jgi:Spy/CpxP family protein refolding chaperone